MTAIDKIKRQPTCHLLESHVDFSRIFCYATKETADSVAPLMRAVSVSYRSGGATIDARGSVAVTEGRRRPGRGAITWTHQTVGPRDDGQEKRVDSRQSLASRSRVL